MSDWGLTGRIVGTGVLSVAVVLSIVTLAMWAIGRMLRRVGSGEGKQDQK